MNIHVRYFLPSSYDVTKHNAATHIPPLSVTVIVEHSQGRQFYAEGKTDDFESFASRRNIKARIKNLFKL